ncbi:hypothetical protein STCU_10638 [Strigomonas culicis]|uniref:Uncharacterized protein n=1 Tax=Strigomonas culicis TaxID=28005 RepID=S9V3I2_9TRYP|nr:hypothetical protein STCU_10638 [Strigomonas culicis]|eukprot:EPY17420.1 hypothetical protein STCU_10638 [Strigomonas culicis]
MDQSPPEEPGGSQPAPVPPAALTVDDAPDVGTSGSTHPPDTEEEDGASAAELDDGDGADHPGSRSASAYAAKKLLDIMTLQFLDEREYLDDDDDVEPLLEERAAAARPTSASAMSLHTIARAEQLLQRNIPAAAAGHAGAAQP